MDTSETTAAVLQHPDVDDAFVTTATSPHSGAQESIVYAVASRPAERWARLIETATATLVDHIAESRGGLVTWRRFWDELDQISVLVIARTLAELGAFQTPNSPVSVPSLMRDHGVAPDHEPLFQQWLNVMLEHGILQPGQGADQFACSEPLSALELDERVQKKLGALVVGGVEKVFADYFIESASQQVGLIRGEVSPLPLLFPDGDQALAETFYAQNPISVVLNEVLAETVREIVSLAPTSRPVRILEIGAGTGATSATVLKRLPADRTQYCFTDVSPYFIENAKKRFAEYGFVDYTVLDLNKDLRDQGFAPGSFDVIVGANVIHTAQRIDHALQLTRSLLTPSGVLVAVERTANTPVQMVTVAFLEGFSQYVDNRKETNLPLLSAERWVTTLQEGGFHRIATLPHGVSATTEMAEHVIVAERSATDQPMTDRLALHSDLSTLLPDPDTPYHLVPLDRIPRDADGVVDEHSLPSPWD